MLTYVLAVAAAAANAASSVLQRKAHRDHPISGSLISQAFTVLRRPIWIVGFGAVIAGFLLQAAALTQGAISVVEPVLIVELPFTLLLASVVLSGSPARRDWFATIAMTAGLAGVLYALAPAPKPHESVQMLTWIFGMSANVGGVIVVYMAAQRMGPQRRALLLGIATGSAFGLTVALMKSVTSSLTERGFASLFAIWQTYGMVLTGLSAMLILQGALNAGSLVAAQPGFTLLDPVVSGAWGVFGYGESVRSGWYAVGAGFAAVVLVGGVVLLTRSPVLDQGPDDAPSRPEQDPAPDPEPVPVDAVASSSRLGSASAIGDPDQGPAGSVQFRRHGA